MYSLASQTGITVVSKFPLKSSSDFSEHLGIGLVRVILYTHSVTGFLRLCLYVSYMSFMLWVLFIPLHIARRIYITAKYVTATPCTLPLCVSFTTHKDWCSLFRTVWFVYHTSACSFPPAGTSRRVFMMLFRLTRPSGT